MQGSPKSFSSALLFAVLGVTVVPGMAAAQDMPPILAPLATPAVSSNQTPPASSSPTQTPPSAEASIPPALAARPAAPPKQEHVAAADHSTVTHHGAKSPAIKSKFAALTRRLTAAHAREVSHHVALRQFEPSFPQGTVMPPPGYYGPDARERLVYGGPPPGLYGGWGGYRGRYPYYP
jgi:hypothetical protein